MNTKVTKNLCSFLEQVSDKESRNVLVETVQAQNT